MVQQIDTLDPRPNRSLFAVVNVLVLVKVPPDVRKVLQLLLVAAARPRAANHLDQVHLRLVHFRLLRALVDQMRPFRLNHRILIEIIVRIRRIDVQILQRNRVPQIRAVLWLFLWNVLLIFGDNLLVLHFAVLHDAGDVLLQVIVQRGLGWRHLGRFGIHTHQRPDFLDGGEDTEARVTAEVFNAGV